VGLCWYYDLDWCGDQTLSFLWTLVILQSYETEGNLATSLGADEKAVRKYKKAVLEHLTFNSYRFVSGDLWSTIFFCFTPNSNIFMKCHCDTSIRSYGPIVCDQGSWTYRRYLGHRFCWW
jgi:hypothetical protein